MKKLMALTLVLCMVLSLASTAMAAETMTDAEAAVAALNAGSDFYYELVENYADSDIEHRTEVRWWMCEGGHTDETLLEELQAMYDAGFRGVEQGSGSGHERWHHLRYQLEHHQCPRPEPRFSGCHAVRF